MSLLRRSSNPFPEPPLPPFPGMNVFGGNTGGADPSMDQALRISTVWACVRMVTDSIAMMPLHAYTFQNGVRVPVVDPPFLLSPASGVTMPDWIGMTMVSVLLRGNVFGQIIARDSHGLPLQIELLNPDQVQVKIIDGRMTLWRKDAGQIPPDDVWHVPGMRGPGSLLGLSPIRYASLSINTEAAIDSFALAYFTDAPHPPSVLTSDQSINKEDSVTLLERINTKLGRREPLILGAGLKFQPLSVSPEESQFLATQRLNVANIARIFGVPPEMIAGDSGSSMSYSNREQRSIDYLTWAVQPWITKLESAISAVLPHEQHVRFDTGVLLRTDLETRIKSGAIAIASKQQTPDEVRAWQGNDLPPLTSQQKDDLALVPLDVSPTGLPKASTPKASTVPEGV